MATTTQVSIFDTMVVPSQELVVPDDAINLDDRFLLSPEFVMLQHLSTIVLNNFEIAKRIQTSQPLIDDHIKWRDNNIAEISKSLELSFPGRWELTTTIDVSMTIYAHQLATELILCKSNMLKFNADNFPNLCYKIVIYFPELVITNSVGHVWTIRDYYVIMNLDIRFCVSILQGYRATKSWKEHRLNYTHSHSSCASNGLVNFCFGYTALDTLVAELKYSFDMMKLDLFFQNLPDYLSWESIEGTPYQSIKALVTHVTPQQRGPDISDSMLDTLVRTVIRGQLVLPINISIIGGHAYATMHKSKEVLRLITTILPSSYHYPLNDTHLLSVYNEQEDPEAINIRIKQINRAELTNTKFTFKGKGVYMQLEEMVINEEKKMNLELFADTRIMDRLVSYIERNLTAYLNDSYWHGTEERGVQ